MVLFTSVVTIGYQLSIDFSLLSLINQLKVIALSPINSLFGYDNSLSISIASEGRSVGAFSLIILVFSIGLLVTAAEKIGLFNNLISSITKSGNSVRRVTTGLIIYFWISSLSYGLYESAICYLPLLKKYYQDFDVSKTFHTKVLIIPLAVGYMFSPINPFATLLIDQVLSINSYDVFKYRLLFSIAGVIFTILLICRQLPKYNKKHEISKYKKFEKMYFSLCIFVIPYVTLTIGMIPNIGFNLSMNQASLIYIISAIVLLAINGSKHSYGTVFKTGLKNYAPVMFSIGFARCIYVIMYNGHVIEPLVNSILNQTAGASDLLVIIVTAFVVAMFCYLIPSPSAVIYSIMPIISLYFEMRAIDILISASIFLLVHGLLKTVSITSPLVLSASADASVSYLEYVKQYRGVVSSLLLLSILFLFGLNL